MKRLFTLFVTVFLLISLTACGQNAAPANSEQLTIPEESPDAPVQTKSQQEHSLDIMKLMVEMSQEEDYIRAFYNEPAVIMTLESIGECDYTAVKNVYAVTVDADEVFAELQLGSIGNISDTLRSVAENKVLTAMVANVNARADLMLMACANICTVDKTFITDEITESVCYLYTFEEAPSISITFLCGEDHIVTARGIFMLVDDISCDSIENVEAYFGGVGVTAVELDI